MCLLFIHLLSDVHERHWGEVELVRTSTSLKAPLQTQAWLIQVQNCPELIEHANTVAVLLTGIHEALELRDGVKGEYFGKGS